MKVLFSVLIGYLLISPSQSIAHGNKVKSVKGAVGMALSVFERDEANEVQKSFVGTKGWIDKTDLWVKVLLAEGNLVVYRCIIEKWEHNDGRDIPVGECTKSPSFRSVSHLTASNV